jgi:hypothetical protein
MSSRRAFITLGSVARRCECTATSDGGDRVLLHATGGRDSDSAAAFREGLRQTGVLI